MKLEQKLENIINEGIVVDNDVMSYENGEIVGFIDNGKFLMKLVVDDNTYLLLCKLNNQSIEVLQLVDEDFITDIRYSVVPNKNLLIKLKWTSFGDIDAYDVRAYEYHFEDDKLLLGEIRYTDLVEKPDMTDTYGIGLTLIDAIDNNYYPYSDIQECFKSLCIIWGEEIDWELCQEVCFSLEEDSEIDIENYK
jgi:hypothetical protein